MLFIVIVFLLGAASSIGLLIYFILTKLTHLENVVIDQKNEISRVTSASYEEMKKRHKEREPDEPAKNTETGSNNDNSPKTWIKISKNPQEDVKLKPWSYAVLKNNMLFEFADDKATNCTRVICLDGCILNTEQTKKGKPLWKVTNSIILIHATRDIISGERSICVRFETAKDLEQWYFLFQRAAALTSKKETDEEKYQRKFWSEMSKRLKNRKVDLDPHWITALFCRLLWRIHDSEGFLEFLTKKFKKKLDKVNKPSFVREIKIQEVNFGPNLPIINSVQLLSVSDEGEVTADADFVYHGGFHLTIEVTFEFHVPTTTRKIVFPAALSVTVQHVEGKAHIHCSPPPSSRFWIGFYGEPKVNIAINTEIGENKYKMRNLPKLANIIVYKIQSEIIELMVLPNMDDWPIPKIPKDKDDQKDHKPQTKEEVSSADIEGLTSHVDSLIGLHSSDSKLSNRKPNSKEEKNDSSKEQSKKTL